MVCLYPKYLYSYDAFDRRLPYAILIARGSLLPLSTLVTCGS